MESLFFSSIIAWPLPWMPSRSDLIVTVPEPLARYFASISAGVRVVPLPFDPPRIAIKQFWHRKFHHDARNRWLRALYTRYFNTDDTAGAVRRALSERLQQAPPSPGPLGQKESPPEIEFRRLRNDHGSEVIPELHLRLRRRVKGTP